MISLLKEEKVNIDQDDAELVIDLWEKVAVIKVMQGKDHFMSEFRREYADDIELQYRVTDEALKKIFDVWKNQLESRNNRSLIRKFWKHQVEWIPGPD